MSLITEVLQRTTSTGSVRAGRPSSIRGEAAMRGVSEYRVRVERREAGARSVARSQHHELTPADLVEARAVAAGHGARFGARALRPITVPDADGNFVQIVPRIAAQRAKLGKYIGSVEQFYRTGDASALARFTNYRPQGIALNTDSGLIEALFLSEMPDEFMSYLEAA